MVNDAICIRGTIVGLSSSVAMTPDMTMEKMVKAAPSMTSNRVLVRITFFSFLVSPSTRYCVEYLIVAWSIPKSLMYVIMLGPMSAIETTPNSASESIPATRIIPMAEITEEITSPQSRLNPPMAETLARLSDLLTTKHPFKLVEQIYSNRDYPLW